MNRRREAFTLIEMLVATLLATILIGGVLAMSAALARDQKRLADRAQGSMTGIIELLRFDLMNARSITQASDGQALVLVGHGGLDRASLAPTNRLTRVIYRVDPQSGNLSREQAYLDDPARPAPWAELAATGVARIDVTPASGDSDVVPEPAIAAALFASNRKIGDVKLVPQLPISLTVPSRVRVRVTSSLTAVDQEIWAR